MKSNQLIGMKYLYFLLFFGVMSLSSQTVYAQKEEDKSERVNFKEIGKDFKKAGKTIGKESKKAGKAIGKESKKAGKAIGKESKKGYNKVKSKVKRAKKVAYMIREKATPMAQLIASECCYDLIRSI